MVYIVKQKFNILELSPSAKISKRVLLVEPEYYVREVYLRHLAENGFEASHSPDIKEALVILKFLQPDVAVLSPHSESSFANFIYGLSLMRKLHPGLPMVTVGSTLPVEVLSAILELGVAGHLEKQLSRPSDIITVIRTVLG